MSKVFNRSGLTWKIESHEHPDIGRCIKVTIDPKKGYHVFLREPLKTCSFNKCNGNPRCKFNHSNGYFAPVEKVDKEEIDEEIDEEEIDEEEIDEEIESNGAPAPIKE